MEKQNDKQKSSWYLSKALLSASNLVKKSRGIYIGTQIEHAMRSYLIQEHGELIKKADAALWKDINK